jgi:cytochrome c
MNTFKNVAVAAVIAAGLGAAPAMAQDADKGERVFKRCAACHTTESGGKNKRGPNLFGVIGRQAGSLEGYRYSKAFKALDFVWDEAKLVEFVAGPKKMVKGTKMGFAGLRKEDDIANIIAYLKIATN